MGSWGGQLGVGHCQLTILASPPQFFQRLALNLVPFKSDPRYIEEVRDWQRFLISQGYDLGHTRADGDFGDYTYKATCDFQSAHGLGPIDGKAGEQTFTSAAKLGFQSGLNAPPDEIIGTTKLRAVKGIDKVSVDFKRKVIDIARNLGTDPNYLLAVMSFETGHRFSPSVRNKASGATGLIQFMPKTAQSLGTTTDKLAAMTEVPPKFRLPRVT